MIDFKCRQCPSASFRECLSLSLDLCMALLTGCSRAGVFQVPVSRIIPSYLKVEGGGGSPNCIYRAFPIKGKMEP